MSEHLKQAREAWVNWVGNQSQAALRETLGLTLLHLEAQEQSQHLPGALWTEAGEKLSAVSSPTTERATTAGPLDVETSVAPLTLREPLAALAAASTAVATPRLQRVLGVLTEAERTHVEQCSGCWGLLERFSLLLGTHAPAAPGTTSTSVSPASKPSADSEEPAASPSNVSSEPHGTGVEPTPWNHGPEQRFVARMAGEWWLCSAGEHWVSLESKFCGICGTARPEAQAPAASGAAGECGNGMHAFNLSQDTCDCGLFVLATQARRERSHE